jgi:hypothetical protein
VPQGLAISNILAEIYVHEVDGTMQPGTLLYLRYVDDILMILETPQATVDHYERLKGVLAEIGLGVSEEKHVTGPLTMDFDYLGYRMRLPTVSVRVTTVRRLESGLARLFAGFAHKTDRRFQRRWLDEAAHRRILLDEVNERITGAVSENRRYGWLFYFSEMTDVHLLYELDHCVRCLWKRYVGDDPPNSLKRFVRALHEARHNQEGSYIHNYDRYRTLEQKLEFLRRRGQLDPESEVRHKEEELERLFTEVRSQSLAQLDSDVGTIS